MKIYPDISDFPLISICLYLPHLSCVSLVYYIWNRIDQLTLSLVMPLKSKLGRMIEHLVNKDCGDLKRLRQNWVSSIFFFFWMAFWKKLVLKYVSYIVLNYRKLILFAWICLGLCQGKNNFFNTLIHNSQTLMCVSNEQEDPFLLPAQCATEQRFSGTF